MNCPCFAKCDQMSGKEKGDCETDCDNSCQKQASTLSLIIIMHKIITEPSIMDCDNSCQKQAISFSLVIMYIEPNSMVPNAWTDIDHQRRFNLEVLFQDYALNGQKLPKLNRQEVPKNTRKKKGKGQMGGKRDYEDIKIHGKDFSAQIPVRTFKIQDMIGTFFQVDASVPIVLNGEKRVIINRNS